MLQSGANFFKDTWYILFKPKTYFASMQRGNTLASSLIKIFVYALVLSASYFSFFQQLMPLQSSIQSALSLCFASIAAIFLCTVLILIVSGACSGNTHLEPAFKVSSPLIFPLLLSGLIVLGMRIYLPAGTPRLVLEALVQLVARFYGLYLVYHGVILVLDASERRMRIAVRILAVLALMSIATSEAVHQLVAHAGGDDGRQAALRTDQETVFSPGWVAQTGSDADDVVKDMARDRDGNIYVVGDTRGSLEGNTHNENTNVYLSSNTDVFVMKFGPDGQKEWSRQFGTADNDTAGGIAVDPAGSVFLTYDTISIKYKPGQSAAEARNETVLLKYSPAGDLVWHKTLGTGSAGRVVADKSGNVCAIINDTEYSGFKGGASLGEFKVATDITLYKVDKQGYKVWAHHLKTPSDTKAMAMAVDGGGNIIFAGYTRGSLGGNRNASTTPDPIGGTEDIFIAKYDPAGLELWTRQLGTPGSDLPRAIAIDGQGNVCVTGATGGCLATDTMPYLEDVFVARYDALGNRYWVKQFGAIARNEGQAAAVAKDGKTIYVAGYTGGRLVENSEEQVFSLFLSKFDSFGNRQGVAQYGATVNDTVSAALVDEQGGVYLAGCTEGALRGQTARGGKDIFLMKLVDASNQEAAAAKAPVKKYIFYCGDKKVFEEEFDGGFAVVKRSGRIPQGRQIRICDETGAVVRETAYRDGKEEGLCRIYGVEGGKNYLSMEVNYRGGKKIGPARTFTTAGRVREEVTYRDDIREGAYVEYYDDGKVKRRGSYRNNREDGTFREYAVTGALREEKTYRDGLLDGPVRSYSEKGQLLEESSYHGGQRDRLRTYNLDGTILTDVTYIPGKNGSVETIYKTYDQDGKLKSIERY